MTVEAAVAFPSRCTVASYGDSPGQFGGRDVNEGVRSKSTNRGVVGVCSMQVGKCTVGEVSNRSTGL